MIFVCIFQYKINKIKGIRFIHLIQEHSNFRNNHINHYKCDLWCFETHIHSHLKVTSLLADLKEEREGHKRSTRQFYYKN
jgi:hypothetical protein